MTDRPDRGPPGATARPASAGLAASGAAAAPGSPADAPIAALASGAGAAAVGIIRLSGAGCHAILARCAARLPQTERTLRLSSVVDPEAPSGPEAVLDEAMIVLFQAPRSYTGEESAEVHCHGGPYIVQRLLGLFFRLGCRAAEPGEFTRRAFLNGKLDLTAAEGIKELVEAESHQQWVAARYLADGRLKLAIEALRTELIGALAYLEAQIDFPDEGDTAALHLGLVRSRVAATAAQLRRLIGSYDNGRVATRGLMVALVGAPNAGKSTLMNALLGRERAIVTAVPGTTRDYLEERCLIDGRLLRLVDMAGLRDDVGDQVEAIGVATALRLAGEADLVVFLTPTDAAPGWEQTVAAWARELTPRDQLQVLTKADLEPRGGAPRPGGWTRISCKTGEGLAELRQLLVAKVDAHVVGLGREAAFVTSARQLAALRDAEAALAAFAAADERGDGEELLAFELQDAAKALRSIIGEVGNEDVLDKVFNDFCIGK